MSLRPLTISVSNLIRASFKEQLFARHTRRYPVCVNPQSTCFIFKKMSLYYLQVCGIWSPSSDPGDTGRDPVLECLPGCKLRLNK